MAELLASLTPRQQQQTEALVALQQQEAHWHADLPVLILERCWLRLQSVSVADLAGVLPPDSSAEAPELVRFRELLQQGLDHLEAEEVCWQ